MNWLEQLCDSTKEMETPLSFWYWSGLATISAILKDNVWLSRGDAYNLYPNIYVMLLAGSAMKKGPPIGLAKSIVKLVNNTKLIVGRSSIQGILKELGHAHTDEKTGKVNTKSTAFVVASEFSSSLVEDPAAFNCLTDLYDRHYNEGEWKQLLKGDQFSLNDATLSMLVATNDPHLKDFVKEKDIYGGFFGRMFVIREENVNKLNPLIKKLKNPPNPKTLALYLTQLSKLRGEFKDMEGTPQGNHYEEWYMDFYGKVREQHLEDRTGTIGRFGDSVLKVAMLISLAEKPELEISMNAMEQALSVCEKFMDGVRRATLSIAGKAQFADQKAIVIDELLSRSDHKITRIQLLRKYWMHMNADELDHIMHSFDQAGIVKPHSYGSVLVYEMPQRIADELISHMTEKSKKSNQS